MSKEQIIQYYRDDSLFPNINEIVFNKQQVNNIVDEYAKEQAIAFATFLGRIQSGEINIRLPKPRMSWPELYQLFLERQNKHP